MVFLSLMLFPLYGVLIYFVFLMTIYAASFISYVSGLCNVHWTNGTSIVTCCDNKKVQQEFH